MATVQPTRFPLPARVRLANGDSIVVETQDAYDALVPRQSAFERTVMFDDDGRPVWREVANRG